ncbi:MAG: hypothetical protein J6Q11_02710 [Fibrobacteraceae bacterium]|nr:hypothetical protein [Fibrobacteraceae bacterium]
MKKNKIISWVVSALTFTFLMACADESPVSPLEEDLEEEYITHYSSSSSCTSIIDCADAASRPHGYSSSSEKYSSSSYYYGNSYSSSSVSESEKCRLGTSSKPDSYCCSYYGYQCVALQEAKTLHFTVTDYYQGSYEWDGLDDPGDPEIYFNIYTYKNGAKAQSLSTGYLLDLKNQTAWSGTKSVALTINSGVDSLKVCPHVIDEDVLSNDDYSSDYCFSKGKLGKLDDYEDVYQYDAETNKYSLYWQWYLY